MSVIGLYLKYISSKHVLAYVGLVISMTICGLSEHFSEIAIADYTGLCNAR